jgi:hypothetical protein
VKFSHNIIPLNTQVIADHVSPLTSAHPLVCEDKLLN